MVVVPAGVSRTWYFLLRDRKGLSCDTSGWGCRPLVSQRRSEGVVPKVLRRARDVTQDDTKDIKIDHKFTKRGVI